MVTPVLVESMGLLCFHIMVPVENNICSLSKVKFQETSTFVGFYIAMHHSLQLKLQEAVSAFSDRLIVSWRILCCYK